MCEYTDPTRKTWALPNESNGDDTIHQRGIIRGIQALPRYRAHRLAHTNALMNRNLTGHRAHPHLAQGMFVVSLKNPLSFLRPHAPNKKVKKRPQNGLVYKCHQLEDLQFLL